MAPREEGHHLLSGKTAIVTGGAQGLGSAIAHSFAAEDARVILVDLQGEKVIEAAKKLPGDGHRGFQCDITSGQSRERALEQIKDECPRIDILCNNAGIQFHEALETMDETRWRQMFDVNIHAMMLMSREVVRLMSPYKSGSIINIGSISSVLAMPRRSAYVTTKTAVLGLTRAMAVEWAKFGIRANSIGPGYHKTPLLMQYIEKGLLDEERIRRRIPMGYLGEVGEVGRVAVFLASFLSTYVTGQHIMVDGGYTVFGAPEDAS